MERYSTLESASGISLYDSGSIPIDRIVLNTINLKIPLIFEWHFENKVSVYVSGNIGRDYTTTFGAKWDFVQMKSKWLFIYKFNKLIIINYVSWR